MAERYLLYDSGCSVCAALAQEVEASSGGRLGVRSLRDPEVQAMLNRAKPGWRWEPMLLEIEGEHVRVFTGLAMRWRLVQLLGPVRALRVARAVARHGGPVLGVDWGRRRFLGRALGALVGWIALRGLGRPVPAAAAPPTPPAPGLPPIRQSRLLEGEERAALLRRFQNHPDLQALGLSAPGPESEAIAVLHELADGNTLEATAWPIGEREVLVAYFFERPVHTEAYVFAAQEEQVQLQAWSVNGRRVPIPSDPETTTVQPMNHCAGCSGNCWMGPYEVDCQACGSLNWICVAGCCPVTCAGYCLPCAQGNVASCILCIACAAVWCPLCVSEFCCQQWVHACCACGPCPGP